MSTKNPRNLGPVPDLTERPRQTIDTVQAVPAINEFGVRAGRRYDLEEAHWKRAAVAADLIIGASTDQRHYRDNVHEVKVAGQANGRVEPGATNPPPAWASIDSRMQSAFAGAVDFGEPGDATPYPYAPRSGSNPRTITSLQGLRRGELQNTAHLSKIAPERGGRGRRSMAETDR